MKIYAIGGSGQEVGQLKKVCEQNGWEMRVMNRLGRPRVSCDVQNVLNAYSELKNIRATARRVQMNPGPVYRILKEAGVLEFQTKR